MTVIAANPGDDLTAIANSLLPGDTLQLNDGTYTNPTGLRVLNRNGTAGAPITVKAVNPGKAIIDGTNVTSPADRRGLVNFDNCTYWILKDFLAKNAAVGSVIQNDNVDFFTLSGLGADFAGGGNWNAIGFGYCQGKGVPNHNLCVDSWATRGRYCFQSFESGGTTFRRCFAFNPSAHNVGFIAPRAGFSSYNESGTHFENCYFATGYPIPGSEDSQSGNPMDGWWITTADIANFPNNNSQLLGCICRNVWEYAVVWQNNLGSGHICRDMYVENHTPAGTIASPDGVTLGGGLGPNANPRVSFDHCTIADCSGFAYDGAGAANPVSYTVFMNNTTAVRGAITSDHNNYWNNGNNGVALSGTDTSINPAYDTATYGNGIRLKRSAALGGATGCEILYQTVNGVLTSTPLWPWPMEARILAETGRSPTWAIHGGLWNTLDGIYPGTTTPPPAPPPGGTSGSTGINYGTVTELGYWTDGTPNPSGNNGNTWNLHAGGSWGNSSITFTSADLPATEFSAYWAKLQVDTTPGVSNERAEISHGGQYEPTTGGVGGGYEWFYSHEVYWPSGAPNASGFPTGSWTNVIQWMDIQALTSPPVSLSIHNDGTPRYDVGLLRIPGQADMFISAGNVAFDVRTSFTWHIKFAQDTSGFVELWRRDGVNGTFTKVVSQTGVRTLQQNLQVYIEAQCYRQDRPGLNTNYHAGIRRHDQFVIGTTATGGTGGTGSDAYSTAILADGPTAYWRLGDAPGATVLADLVSGTHAFDLTLAGGVTLGQSSLLAATNNSSALFDGVSGMGSATLPGLHVAGAGTWTIEAWISPTAASASGRIFQHGDEATNLVGYLLAMSAGKLSTEQATGAGTTTRTLSTTVLASNTIYHVVATYDGTNTRLYVNGVLDTITAVAQNCADTGHGTSIGNSTYWASTALNAGVDEVAVYIGKVLTLAQIANHYSVGRATSSTIKHRRTSGDSRGGSRQGG